MIRDIEAKTILGTLKQPDLWFGLKYNFNLYRGCQHQCIYCDSRSECYQIENFSDILVKVNGIEILDKELSKKRVKGTIGTGSMNDPYMPLEAARRMTARALDLIAKYAFPVHIITKGNLVVRDIPVLQEIAKVYAAVSFTITTSDDHLGKKIEPGAPLVSERFAAMKKISSAGILTGITMMPILPYIEDNEKNIESIIEMAADNGAKYIIPAFGVTLRDRQRDYYYQKLDLNFPGLREKYSRRYGNKYFAQSDNSNIIQSVFTDSCAKYQIETKMPFYQSNSSGQLSLF